jgi:uncharacterized membrane protein/tetratricopeptide (TPR) repeat protein
MSAGVKTSLPQRIPVVLFFVLFAGVFLRFFYLNHILLYDDEPLHQIRISYQPLPFAFAHYNGSALFTLLIHALLRLGDIVLMARLPSALFGAITIIAVYVLGTAFFSKREGLIAAGLAALSPFLIRYSQYSRAYALFVLLSLLSLYFFDRAQKDNRTRTWILYAVFTVLNIFTHLVAFLLLPAYGLFIVLTAGRPGKKTSAPGDWPSSRFKNFIFWTLIICVLAACFYLPSVSIKEFFAGSAQRAIFQPADVRLSPLLIHDILQAQWKPPSPFFYVLFLACLALGFGAAFQKQRRAAGLSLLWVAVPYLIFILIRPRDVNVLSADRYFIFMLPVLLLFMAKGITAFGALGSTLALPFKLPKAVKPVLRNVFQAVALILIAAGLGSSFKDHYLDHWRLGSLRLDNDIAAYLKKEVKRDAVIYFDAWPVSSLNTMINPLTQDLKPEEFELMCREGFIAKARENDFIIFRVGPLFYQEYVAGRGIDLWAVAALDAGSASRVIGEAKNRPGVKVRALNGRVVLHLHNDDEEVAQKMLILARLFLSLPLEERRAQQYRLLAAKAALMVYGPEEAYQDIQAYKSAAIPSDELKTIPSSHVFRFLDRIFGLSPAALYGRTESKALAEIERLLFVGGNGFLRQNDFDNALKAYLESLSLGKDFSLRISDKLAVLAEKRTGQGKFAEARILFQKALDLNPGREDFRFFLAEAFRKEGATGRAEQAYQKAFGLPSLPRDFLEQLADHPQSPIAWPSGRLWHLMFRAEEDTAIFGTMAAPKISAVKKTGFDIYDSLRITQNGLQFAVAAKKGAVKILSFKIAKNKRPKFDIKINGRRETGNVIVIN